MAFGRPTRYWQLDSSKVHASSSSQSGKETWDQAVTEASEEYKKRMVHSSEKKKRQLIFAVLILSTLQQQIKHNICCDNCHSHVAMALNLMDYDRTNWNMVNLCFLMLFKGSFIGY